MTYKDNLHALVDEFIKSKDTEALIMYPTVKLVERMKKIAEKKYPHLSFVYAGTMDKTIPAWEGEHMLYLRKIC